MSVECQYSGHGSNILTYYEQHLFLETLIVAQLVKQQLAFFMEPQGSLPCSQNPAIDPTLSQPNPIRPMVPCLPKVYLNVILPPTPRSSQWFLHSGLQTKTP